MTGVPNSGSDGGSINKADIRIVIAAFNEGSAIGKVVQELLQFGYPTIVVDDGSSDDTANVALAAGAIVLRHPLNRGQGAALQTGIAYALKQNAQVIVTFDADGQHRVSDLPAMIVPILSNEVDITVGSRFLGSQNAIPRGRRLLLRAAVIFTRITSRVKLTDAHNGFRAFSNKAAQKIDIQLDRMAHASEIIDQIRHSGLKYKEIPVHIEYTAYSMEKGQSSSNAVRVAADYLVDKLIR